MNTKRIMLVQVARKALALDEEAYRAILRNYGGVESATALDDRSFARVMDRFRHLGFVSDKRAAAFSAHNRHGMATAAQIEMIRELWAANTGSADEGGLNHWLERHFRISALRFLPRAKAHKVIGALRTWEARMKAKAGDEVATSQPTQGCK